jgi:molybdopterin/thiamine biosynthesis adenylyltransferase/rhodanese-related sulfurtransferase
MSDRTSPVYSPTRGKTRAGLRSEVRGQRSEVRQTARIKMIPVSLSPDELLRYSRHTLLPEFGLEGQERLKAGRVLVVGAGGLGSPVALYLAAAGVGTIGLVDFDTVDVTNLQRQVLYGTADVGRPKLDVAAARLRDINPHITITLHREAFGASNARALVEAYDVVVDGTDNFSTRFLVNDACVMAGRPNVYGSVFRFEGQASVFATKGGPCYRCLHPEPPPAGLIPNCAEAGVLGVLPGLIGTIQATEAIKLLTGIGEPLVGKLLLYDALRMRVRQIALPRDPACPVCGDAPTIRELVAYDAVCETTSEDEITVEELDQGRREKRPHYLLDVREQSEYASTRIEGSQLIPLLQLQANLKHLPKDQTIVVYCQTGGRSLMAVGMLRMQGFDAKNLSGGIKAWRARIGA